MSDNGVDGFTAAAREGAFEQLAGERDNLVFQAIQQSHDRLREAGAANDYDIEPVIDSLELIDADRDAGEVRWGWSHPAAEFFEFGTSEHTVDGDPVLSFVWEDPPSGIEQAFESEGDGVRVFFSSVEVAGIEETRFVRAGLEWLAREGDSRGVI